MRNRYSQAWVVLSLLLLFSVLATSEAVQESLTYDEPAHYKYGEQILNLDSSRFDDSKMPFSILNVLPVKLIQSFFPGLLEGHWQFERIGRISTIGISILLGLLIYKWSNELFGGFAGIFSLLFFALEPNIIAHSHLITTDIFAAFAITLSVYCFWRFTNTPNLKWGLTSSLCLGLAQLAKYTSVFLFPLLLLVALVQYGPSAFGAIRRGNGRAISRGLRLFFGYFILHIGISLIVINAGFLFNKSFLPLGDYQFHSDLFLNIQDGFSRFSGLPVPFPQPYVEGLDLIRFRERTGVGYGGIYLLGDLRNSGGFLGYFFTASLLKVPIATQLFILVAIIDYILRREKSGFLNKEWYLVGPVLFFAVYFNFFFRAQIGLRYYLVIFPFMLVFIGSLFREWEKVFQPKLWLVVTGCTYLFLSVLSYYPHHLSYVNEIIWDRTKAYRYLADSNIDWGQNEAYLTEYLETHSNAIIEPAEPIEGLLIVSVNRLVGVRGGPEQYRWLRDNFEPIGHLVYSYLIYEITLEDLDRIQ